MLAINLTLVSGLIKEKSLQISYQLSYISARNI